MSAEFLPQHAKYFTDRAVDPAFAASCGVFSVETREQFDSISDTMDPAWKGWANFPAFFFTWTDGEHTEHQVHPDTPRKDEKTGRTRKFLFRKGMEPVLWAVREMPGAKRAIVAEGGAKALAAALYAPDDVSIYGIAGVRMWQTKGGVPLPSLARLADHEVLICFDGDASTNPDVYGAGTDLKAALDLFGATSVKFLQLPVNGDSKAGLDDLLALVPTAEGRRVALERLIKSAGVRPAKKQPKPQGESAPAGMEPVNVTNQADAADWLRVKLGTGALAGYFNREGQIVHVPVEGQQGYQASTSGEVTDESGRTYRDHDGPAQVRTASASQLAARVGFGFWCFTDAEKTGKRHAMFPPASANAVSEVPELAPGLRHLKGVVHTPLVRRDGSVLDTPGYDPATGLYFLPTDGLAVPPVPDQPTAEQMATAVDLLGEAVHDFPFRSDDHRANFLGLLLTPLLRELCPPPYKLGVFDAPQSRSGKTLLSKVLRALHGGVVRASIPVDDAEWSKTITTILNVTTAPVVTFDNVRGQVVSGVLDSLLTEAEFSARKLGTVDELVRRVNDRVWTLTSNNAKLGGDLAKRAVWVSINPNTSNPEERTGFKHPALVRWVQENRGPLLAALLTLVRGWDAAGRPAPSQKSSDEWKHWVETVRAILENAGVKGMFDRPESKRQAVSDEDADWATFLAAAHRAFGDDSWTCQTLVTELKWGEVAEEDPLAVRREELPHDLGNKHAQGHDIVKSLGRFIGYRADAWHEGYMIREAGPKNRRTAKSWVVEVDHDFLNRAKSKEGSKQDNETSQGVGYEGLRGLVPTFAGEKTLFLNDLEDKSMYGRVEELESNPSNPQTPSAAAPPPGGSVEDRERRDQAAYKAEHPEPMLINFPCPSCGANPADLCSPDPEGCYERHGLLIEAHRLWDMDAVNHSMNLGYERQQDPGHLAGYRCTTDNHVKFMQGHGVLR